MHVHIHKLTVDMCFCRRTRRQDIRNGDPLTQCSDLQHQGMYLQIMQYSSIHIIMVLSSCSVHTIICVCVSVDNLNGQPTVLDKTVYGVENSTTFLECSAKSQRALTYWQYQQANDDRRQDV